MKKLLLPSVFVLLALASKAQTTILSEGFNVTSATAAAPSGWSLSSSGSSTGCYGITWNQVPSGGFICSVNGAPAPTPSANSGSGMAGYNSWDIANGSTSNLITPSLNFSTAGSYTVSFYVYNYAIAYGYDSLRILVNTSASATGATLLAALVPNRASSTGWTQYTYTIPASYTGTSNYIIFRGVSNYGYDIFIDDVEVVFTPPPPCTGTPTTPVITTAAYTAAAPLCGGSTQTITATAQGLPTVSGMTYQWETSTSSSGPWSSVIGGTGANTRTYTTPALFASAYYRLNATCTNSSITASSSAYYLPVGSAQPGFINGISTFCAGDTATYSVPAVSGTSYTWTLPSGWTGFSATNSILVTPNATAGSISVTGTTSCGISIARSITLTPGSIPSPAGSIFGNTFICAGSTQTYSVLPIAGVTTYVWGLPTGWTGSSTSTSITVTAGSTSGNITVKSSNGCGQSVAQTLAVTILTSLAAPGTITGNASPCSGDSVVYNINKVPGASSYVWTLPSGWSGTTTDTTIKTFPAVGTGSLSVTAYNACAISPATAKTITVTASVNPAVTIVSSATAPCQSAAVTFTATPTSGGSSPTYQWKKNGLNVATGVSYTTNTLTTGDVVSVVLTSNAVCAKSTTATSNAITANVTPSVTPGVSINATPGTPICQGETMNFTTLRFGGGGGPTYQWYKNNVAIAGATDTSYSDGALNDRDTLTIRMTTTATCATIPFATSNKVGVRVNPIIVPTVSIAVSPSDIITPGVPVTFTATQSGGGGTPTYQWLKNGVNISGETNSSYTTTTLKSGDRITVEMFSYAPCANPQEVASNEIVLKSSLGVASANGWDGDLSMYPNPTTGRFTIAATWAATNAGKRVSIDVLNMLGQAVYHSEVVPGTATWHLDVQLPEGVANGHYILRVSSEGMRSTAPFVLNR